MKIPIIVIAALLTWVAFDTDLFQRRGFEARAEEVLTLGSVERRAKRRVLRRHSLDVIPLWARGARPPVRMKVNHFVNRSRDPRDSDQRKIRRKFTNM
jgi:hypothetical protein